MNGIVTHEYTETLPPDVENELGELPQTSSEKQSDTESSLPDVPDPDDIYGEDDEKDEDEGGNDDEDDKETGEKTPFWLENDGRRLLTSVKWGNLDASKESDHDISYSVNGIDVKLSLVAGTRELYHDAIEERADSLGAKLTEEVISYSPSRVYDLFEYDKYTLEAYDENANSDWYTYYFVSQADYDLCYLVTLNSYNTVDNDNEVFGILEYTISAIEE